jgi:hypothetical protein
MNENPTATRLVPVDRLTAITSLIAEGAVFEGNFHTASDQGIKVDGRLLGNITFESGGTLHVGATGVIENTRLEAGVPRQGPGADPFGVSPLRHPAGRQGRGAARAGRAALDQGAREVRLPWG